MSTIQLNSYGLASPFASQRFKYKKQNVMHLNTNIAAAKQRSNKFTIRAIGTVPERGTDETTTTDSPSDQEPACINFAFVHSVLLPDGTPDVHIRTTTGGQDLRTIMLDNQIELYGPYARALLNCAGGGTCGTCLVEVVEGKEILSPRTDKEREILKKKPKNWRLACQTTVGTPDSRGLVVIQQLPEWKGHEWKQEKEAVPPESEEGEDT
nr:photosynthetic NDH subunit of subcomplex B 3 [Fagopyrum tataricum]